MRHWCRSFAAAMLMACGGEPALPCVVALQPVLTVGADTGAWAFQVAPAVSPPLVDGSHLVLDLSKDADPVLWHLPLNGQPVPMARRGAGPGELQSPGRFADFRHDSLLVADPGASRLVVLAPDGRPSRSVQLGLRPAEVVATPGPTFIVATGRRDSLALVRIDSLGRVLGGIPVDSLAGRVSLARGTDEGVWILQERGTALQHWTPRGTDVLAAPGAGWVAALQAEVDHPPVGAPGITGLWADSTHVWVGSVVRDRRWKDAIVYAPARDALHVGVEKVVDRYRAYDGLLEALDRRTGAVVGRLRQDTAGYPIAPALLGQPSETPAGAPVLRLHRVTLHCPAAA